MSFKVQFTSSSKKKCQSDNPNYSNKSYSFKPNTDNSCGYNVNRPKTIFNRNPRNKTKIDGNY